MKKHKIVMHNVTSDEERQGRLFFPADETIPGLECYIMGGDDWNAMGKPETITVTVEPGDTLNDE